MYSTSIKSVFLRVQLTMYLSNSTENDDDYVVGAKKKRERVPFSLSVFDRRIRSILRLPIPRNDLIALLGNWPFCFYCWRTNVPIDRHALRQTIGDCLLLSLLNAVGFLREWRKEAVAVRSVRNGFSASKYVNWFSERWRDCRWFEFMHPSQAVEPVSFYSALFDALRYLSIVVKTNCTVQSSLIDSVSFNIQLINYLTTDCRLYRSFFINDVMARNASWSLRLDRVGSCESFRYFKALNMVTGQLRSQVSIGVVWSRICELASEIWEVFNIVY